MLDICLSVPVETSMTVHMVLVFWLAKYSYVALSSICNAVPKIRDECL